VPGTKTHRVKVVISQGQIVYLIYMKSGNS